MPNFGRFENEIGNKEGSAQAFEDALEARKNWASIGKDIFPAEMVEGLKWEYLHLVITQANQETMTIDRLNDLFTQFARVRKELPEDPDLALGKAVDQNFHALVDKFAKNLDDKYVGLQTTRLAADAADQSFAVRK